MDNIVIKSAAGSRDQLLDDLGYFDNCLTYADAANYLTYYSFGPCMTSRSGTSTAPGLCNDDSTCLKQPVTFATNQVSSSTLPYSTAMGLAKDGHIIVGPYNSSGELWSCDDHDACNGVFLADNSYAYAMTYTFPYVVGCFGPGPT